MFARKIVTRAPSRDEVEAARDVIRAEGAEHAEGDSFADEMADFRERVIHRRLAARGLASGIARRARKAAGAC